MQNVYSKAIIFYYGAFFPSCYFLFYFVQFNVLIGKSRRTTNVNGIRVFVLSVHMGHMCTNVT